MVPSLLSLSTGSLEEAANNWHHTVQNRELNRDSLEFFKITNTMMSTLKIRSQLYHNRDLEMTTKTAVIIPYLVRSQDRQLSDGFSKKNSEGVSALVEIQVRWIFSRIGQLKFGGRIRLLCSTLENMVWVKRRRQRIVRSCLHEYIIYYFDLSSR